MRGSSAKTKTLTIGVSPAVKIVDVRVNRAACVVYNTTGTLMIKYVTPDDPAPASDILFSHSLAAGEERTLEDFTGEMSAIKKGSGTTVVMVTEIW